MSRASSISEKIYSLNWGLIFFVTLVSCIGFAVLYSAAAGSFSPWASKQIIRFIVLFPVMLFIAVVDIRFWIKSSYYFYAIVFIGLVITEFMGATAMGATRWVRIGGLNWQPSEMMKLCVVFALARYFHTISIVNVKKISYLIIPILMVLLPVGLVLKQPDLGTASILLMVGGAMFFVAGVRMWKFIAVGVAGLVSAPFIWTKLHDYQKNRVLAFLHPEEDPLGTGYNILQSKIAIGSGGLSGKGFLNGSQSQLNFLPEKQTDFIFTMFTEEFGFIGGVTVISLYAIIIAYGIYIATKCKNHFGRLMAIGITSILSIHIFVNIAMVMGMIPAVGAPLPLLSYGGTIMMTMMLAFGLLLNADLYGNEVIGKDAVEV